MSSDSFQQPLQLKGEIMDLEFTVDTDHRKRRRNRTTQSCLNCHTSKRKCDRKRPCQRCIQLGLTGLCVYEIDDPALRDDPSLDEATRLRKRIAELESLVNLTLVGPTANFRDGDPSERWHSRAAKNSLQLRRRPRSPETLSRPNHDSRGLVSVSGAPIKVEPITEISQPHLYRFTPSPPASYPGFHSDNSASPPYERQNGHHYNNGNITSNGRSTMTYPSPTSNNGLSYTHHQSDSPSYHENGNVYQINTCDPDKVYGTHFPSDSPPSQTFCACRTSPAAEHALVSLGQHLQNTLASLRQYTQHPENSHCQLFRRITDLNTLMHGNDPDEGSGSPYGTLPTPTESEIMSSHSSSSTPFHGSSAGTSVSEWSEQPMYSNIIT
ncbi:hypothetical protein BU15DRAFT_87727 [Melanogaster broomeanus]|nr:hypothetical protein BU15DRAFT_87727 [Melanogaster broomeanus]